MCAHELAEDLATWQEQARDYAAREPAPAPEFLAPQGVEVQTEYEDDAPDGGMSETAQAEAALARVLSWFAPHGTREAANVTRAQLARAYADGGLQVPEEMRRFL